MYNDGGECPGSLNVWQSPSHRHVETRPRNQFIATELKDEKRKMMSLSNNNGRQGPLVSRRRFFICPEIPSHQRFSSIAHGV
jgi:hypothetical protein